MSEKTPKRRVREEEVPKSVDLAPKNQKLPRPRALERHMAATRNCADSWEELDHDEESPGEACAQRGGPKTRRSTTQDAKEPKSTHNNVAAIHRIYADGEDRNKPARSQARRERTGEDPTTVDLLPTRRTQN
jgi:hypothetical protein